MNIVTEHHPSAPPHLRYSAVDADTYDGAPDSDSTIGTGATEDEARGDLEEQLEEGKL